MTARSELKITVGDGAVSALLDRPASPWAGYVFAHGADHQVEVAGHDRVELVDRSPMRWSVTRFSL